ncbi:MAG: NUDIX hydrolase [Desulfobacteraceae bacterium 4572_88]|nr:MAG: NUDIX hydrolase [Desulfobacteraceae bacterium 4572_88]
MHHTAQNDELLDIVDKNDNVVSRKMRSEIYLEGLRCFRVINAFVRNSQGQLWIPRRSASKDIFPLGLDVSVGGHVGSGETYEQALTRESEEELSLNTDEADCRFLGYLSPYEHGVSAFMKVYEIRMDEVPDYNSEDFTEFFWQTPRELLEWIKKGEPAKDDLPKLVRIFYGDSL